MGFWTSAQQVVRNPWVEKAISGVAGAGLLGHDLTQGGLAGVAARDLATYGNRFLKEKQGVFGSLDRPAQDLFDRTLTPIVNRFNRNPARLANYVDRQQVRFEETAGVLERTRFSPTEPRILKTKPITAS